MRVVNRILLILLVAISTNWVHAQISPKKATYFYLVNDILGPGRRLLNLNNLNGMSIPRANLYNQGTLVFSISNQNLINSPYEMYIGESRALKVNGPVQSGDPIIVSGKGLLAASVNVDIVNDRGESMNYVETNVRLNNDQDELTLYIKLVPGIYTLQIPVADGVISKTVIVQ